MRKIRSQKNHINIRKGFRFISTLSLVLILSIMLGGSITSTTKVQAAGTQENSQRNPLYKVSLEEFLGRDTGKPLYPGYTWLGYSNTESVSRPYRAAMFASYYYSQIDEDVASSYGWPLLPKKDSYNTKEYDVGHNDTSADSGNDLYLLEFSTANDVSITNIDIKYSVYFLKKEKDGYTLRFTDDVELSKDSRDFLDRKSRGYEFCKGELEMTTFQLPKDSVPVGIFVWQDGSGDDYAWEFSYMDMYKVDSISYVHKYLDDIESSAHACANNYRLFTGTRVGYIDAESIKKKYMASTDGGATTTDHQYFEWLYPLSPVAEEASAGYALEIVTQPNGEEINPANYKEMFRSAYVTLYYTLKNGMTGSRIVELAAHPY